MKYRTYIGVIILSIFCFFCAVKSRISTTTRNIEITAEEEKLRDPEGYNSIKSIHAILDDDQSGSIDRYESADFLAEDLKFGEKERERREKTFHENDESITVDDLWMAWFESEERNWDQKQVLDWLINIVKLPQYASNFQKAEVTGRYMPRMAAQNSTYLNSLGIRSIVHKQKLQLKALDIVLFGSHDFSTILKDIALACLLVILITVLIVFKTHKNRSKKQMEELSTRLSKLRDMETDFEGVQQKLDDENLKRQSIDDDENIDVNQLQELEAEREGRMTVDINSGGYGLPFNLQNLLRRTFVIESAYLNQQKLECLHEMREAKELVDKMRRKQTSIMNSLKLATGATSGTGDIDTKIFHLKTRMEKIKLAVDELAQRWADIESMCGFSITGPFGIVAAQSPPNLDTNHIMALKYQTEQHNMAIHYSSMPNPNSTSFLKLTDSQQINAATIHDNWGNHHQNSLEENNHRIQSSLSNLHQSAAQLPKLPSPSSENNNNKSSPPPSEFDVSSIVSGQSSSNANPINNKKGNRRNQLKQLFRKKLKS